MKFALGDQLPSEQDEDVYLLLLVNYGLKARPLPSPFTVHFWRAGGNA